jgi:hypothetical protein
LSFFAGLIKYWWVTRRAAKQAVIDQEKNARLAEISRTGLNVRRESYIPFGVRAIQEGIEVDGIWISRPSTPFSDNPSQNASAATLVGDHDPYAKGKGKNTDSHSLASSSLKEPRRIRIQTPSDGSIYADGGHEAGDTSPRTTYAPRMVPPSRPQVHFATTEPQVHYATSQQDTLNKLEGKENGGPKIYTPSRGSNKAMNYSEYEQHSYLNSSPTSNKGYSNVEQMSPRATEPVNPFSSLADTPPLEADPFPYDTKPQEQRPLMQQQILQPEPSFGPNDRPQTLSPIRQQFKPQRSPSQPPRGNVGNSNAGHARSGSHTRIMESRPGSPRSPRSLDSP